jgi:5-formyltetrahydrofolate cyclo-ligase
VDKAGWRRWARGHRLAPVDPEPFVAALAGLLAQAPAGWVVTYRAMAHEVDVSAVEAVAGLGPFALVRTVPGFGLSVHPATAPLERHRWGFDQPVAGAAEVPVGEVAVVVVPGLAFDRRGQRLGHGAGYYDRFLGRLRPGAWRVGVTPAALVVDSLPVDPHDRPMTHLVTEHGVTACPAPGGDAA